MKHNRKQTKVTLAVTSAWRFKSYHSVNWVYQRKRLLGVIWAHYCTIVPSAGRIITYNWDSHLRLKTKWRRIFFKKKKDGEDDVDEDKDDPVVTGENFLLYFVLLLLVANGRSGCTCINNFTVLMPCVRCYSYITK